MLKEKKISVIKFLPSERINKTNVLRTNNFRCLDIFFFFKVKFLKSKEGSAMVQMGDAMAVDRCMQNLNYVTLFGNKITLG